MIILATIPLALAQMSDLVEYQTEEHAVQREFFYKQCESIGRVHLGYGKIEVVDESAIRHIQRPIFVSIGTTWVTSTGQSVKILETRAPGNHPIIAMQLGGTITRLLHFGMDGRVSTDPSHHLAYPESLHNEKRVTIANLQEVKSIS